MITQVKVEKLPSYELGLEKGIDQMLPVMSADQAWVKVAIDCVIQLLRLKLNIDADNLELLATEQQRIEYHRPNLVVHVIETGN
ncbi:MAG: hypothetical protein V3V31_07555 [Methylococcales bacterium]